MCSHDNDDNADNALDFALDFAPHPIIVSYCVCTEPPSVASCRLQNCPRQPNSVPWQLGLPSVPVELRHMGARIPKSRMSRMS